MARDGTTWWVGAALVLAVCSGCTGSDRPSAAEWRRQWEPVVAEVPVPSEADRLDADRCQRLLTTAREARPDLEPAPSEELDEPVTAWLDLAEEVGFECERTPDLVAVLDELADLRFRIEEELEVGR